MKKPTNWDRYFQSQMRNPRLRQIVEEELKILRVGIQLARLRERAALSQTQLAARAGMSGPNVSRIENHPSQNLTLGTLVRLARAMNCEAEISFKSRRGAPAVKR